MSLPATLAQHVPRHGWASTATTPQRRRNSCIGISLELGRFHLSCLTRSLAGCWTDEPPVFRAGRPRVLLLRLLSRTPEIAEPCCNITKTVRHMGFQFSTKRRNPGPAGCQAEAPTAKPALSSHCRGLTSNKVPSSDVGSSKQLAVHRTHTTTSHYFAECGVLSEL